jgi:hypothetical protein
MRCFIKKKLVKGFAISKNRNQGSVGCIQKPHTFDFHPKKVGRQKPHTLWIAKYIVQPIIA